MKFHKFAVSLFALLPVASAGFSAAIVDATGTAPGSVTTISDALLGSESEIIVKNTGTYHEALMITRDVVLRGEDPANPPVVVLKGNPSQPTLGTGDGIYAGGTLGGSGDLSIEINDFVFVPSLTDPITDDGFSVTPNTGARLTFKMDNILCAPNNGSDQPSASTVWEPLSGTRIPGAWFYLMSETRFGGFEGNTDITLTSCTFIGAGSDATVFYPGAADGGSITLSGIGTSHSGRYATQVSGIPPVTISGTKAQPSWISRKDKVGPIFFQGGAVNIDNMVILDSGDLGLRVDADSVQTLNLSDSLIVNSYFQGISMAYVSTAAKNWSISNCTFVNNGTNVGAGQYGNIETGATTTGDLNVTVTDCVIAGSSGPGINNAGAANLTINNSALVTNGPDALPSAVIGSGPVTQNNVINDDPVFASKDIDPLVEASFDVTAAAYATASSTNGQLNAWGEGPNSSVSTWSLY